MFLQIILSFRRIFFRTKSWLIVYFQQQDALKSEDDRMHKKEVILMFWSATLKSTLL